MQRPPLHLSGPSKPTLVIARIWSSQQYCPADDTNAEKIGGQDGKILGCTWGLASIGGDDATDSLLADESAFCFARIAALRSCGEASAAASAGASAAVGFAAAARPSAGAAAIQKHSRCNPITKLAV